MGTKQQEFRKLELRDGALRPTNEKPHPRVDWHLTSGLTDVPLEDPEMQAVAVQAYAQHKLDQMHDDGLSPAHVDIVDGDGVTHRVPAVQLHDNRLP